MWLHMDLSVFKRASGICMSKCPFVFVCMVVWVSACLGMHIICNLSSEGVCVHACEHVPGYMFTERQVAIVATSPWLLVP